MASKRTSEAGARRASGRAARRGVLVGLGVLAAMLAAASLAFACTAIMGPLTLNPTSGKAGSAVSSSASGLKVYPAKYEIHFTPASWANCMSFTAVTVLKTIATNSRGEWTNVPVTIPASAARGNYEICGMESYPVKGGTGTSHQIFTVL